MYTLHYTIENEKIRRLPGTEIPTYIKFKTYICLK